LALAVSIALGQASTGFAASPLPKTEAQGKRAIIGGNTNAIIGGDTNAIIGGDTNAIIGGDTNAIIGGDTNAIIGGDANAIIGGDANAIIGGDTDAIIGGDMQAMLARGVIAHGPIDSLDVAQGRVVLLGKVYRFGGSVAQMEALSSRLASGETVLATVTGAPDHTGAMKATALSLSNSQYVPGSTEIMLVGRVRTVEASVGTMSVGGLRVDYSAVLATADVQLAPGQVIAVIGVRSAPDLPLVASSVKVL
jgi:hypothetical protein